MRRLAAKNPPERPQLSAETGIVENGRQDPGRNGLFSIDDGFPGSRRLDGGDHLDQTGCSPHSHRNQSPKLESGTEFFAAETGRRTARNECRPARLSSRSPYWIVVGPYPGSEFFGESSGLLGRRATGQQFACSLLDLGNGLASHVSHDQRPIVDFPQTKRKF
jgi:hypothetical protein